MFHNLKRTLFIILIIFVLLIFPSWASASASPSAELIQYQIEELNKKVELLIINESQNKDGDSDKIINVVNNQLQVITVILAVVAIAIPAAGYLLRNSVKKLEERARLSAENMDKRVREIGNLEKAIIERKKQFDGVYSELETLEKELTRKLKTMKRKPGDKSKLSEIEEEILELKRKLSQAIRPYATFTSYPSTASGSTVSSWPGSTTVTYTTSTSPSATSGTTTTVEPFYPLDQSNIRSMDPDKKGKNNI